MWQSEQGLYNHGINWNEELEAGSYIWNNIEVDDGDSKSTGKDGMSGGMSKG